MRRKTIQKQIEALNAAQAALSQELHEEQDRDVSATQSDLTDVSGRLDALEKQQDNILSFLVKVNQETQEYIENKHAELCKVVSSTFGALIEFERDRRKLLEARLRGMKGEENGQGREKSFHKNRLNNGSTGVVLAQAGKEEENNPLKGKNS